MPQNLLKIYDGREHFWQFDTGQKLIVLDRTIDQIHFSNKSMTKAIIKEVYVDDDGVRICDVPDMMLKMPHSLIAYSYVMNDDSNKTICMTKFSVSTRQIPEDYSYEENNRFKDLVDKIESVEDILESGTSIKRFNSLDEANAYVQDYKESGVLLSVWNGEEWALYMVAENYNLEQIGDLDQLILDVEQLQILVGDEPVADQISHAILEQDLPNTYEKLGAADAVRNELRDEVERAKFEETAITRELHKINGNIENLQDDIEDVNSAFDEYKKSNDAAVKEIADDYLKAADKTELEGKIATAQNAADKAQGEVDTLAGVVATKAAQADLEALAGRVTTVEEYVDNAITIIPTPDVSGQIEDHNTSTDAHEDIRSLIANLNALVGDSAVSEQISTSIAAIAKADFIPAPTTATVGQLLSVKAVDENGKPTEWETVEISSVEGSNGIGIKSIRIEEVI